jgi:Skp family chaperone for outer membrane proteins
MVSREQIFAQSLVGQAASGRLKQLGQKAQSNLEAQRRKLEADAKALQAKEAVTPPADVQRRQQQLQGRAQGLQVEAGQAQRELEATRAKVMGLIEEAVQPVILSVYQSKGCGLLLSRDAVLGGNLDAKMTTLTFEREHLPPAATPTR